MYSPFWGSLVSLNERLMKIICTKTIWFGLGVVLVVFTLNISHFSCGTSCYLVVTLHVKYIWGFFSYCCIELEKLCIHAIQKISSGGIFVVMMKHDICLCTTRIRSVLCFVFLGSTWIWKVRRLIQWWDWGWPILLNGCCAHSGFHEIICSFWLPWGWPVLLIGCQLKEFGG